MDRKTKRTIDELRSELHLCYENGKCTDPERAVSIHKRIEREQHDYYVGEALLQDQDAERRAEDE